MHENCLVSRLTDMTSMHYELPVDWDKLHKRAYKYSPRAIILWLLVFTVLQVICALYFQDENVKLIKELKLEIHTLKKRLKVCFINIFSPGSGFFLSNCCSNPSIHKWTEFLCVDKPAALIKYVRAPGAISNKWKQRIYWSISSEH